jgi:hypothetical protein
MKATMIRMSIPMMMMMIIVMVMVMMMMMLVMMILTVHIHGSNGVGMWLVYPQPVGISNSWTPLGSKLSGLDAMSGHQTGSSPVAK